MSSKSDVRKREGQYAKKLETNIIFEKTNENNPFLVDEVLFHGFEHFDLVSQLSYTDMIYLLIIGEAPTEEKSELFRKLAVTFCNPGIRHAATQAAMATGTGRTDRLHILPISLGVFSGEFDAAGKIELIFNQLTMLYDLSLEQALEKIQAKDMAGFGSLYGNKDPYAEKILEYFMQNETRFPLLEMISEIQTKLINTNTGVSKQTIAAAILRELGFTSQQSGPVFQLLAAPGLLAHGLEYSSKPMSSMLFESDEQYEWQKAND